MQSIQKNSDEQFCVIGGSGRIGNKVMSMLLSDGMAKLCIVPTLYTVNKVGGKGMSLDYRLLLNEQIYSYNQNKAESEHKICISNDTQVYPDITLAYKAGNREFIFCGKDSDEVYYFINELKNIHNNILDPVTFLSVADRLTSDNRDLNVELKQDDLISHGIFYHHADMITEAGKNIKREIEELKSNDPRMQQYNYEVCDYWQGAGYAKAFNTTRKICRLLGCAAVSLAATKSMDENGTIKINEHVSVSIARGKDNLPLQYQWLVNEKAIPSIGVRIVDPGEYNENTRLIKQILFSFKQSSVEHVEDMAKHVCEKARNKIKKDRLRLTSV